MSLLILSFLAWILSVLAPCVLPVLPVILGSSLGAQKRYRPLVIVFSTAFFIVLFTLLLKVSTALIDIPQWFRTTFSAVIIIVYGITLIRPTLRDSISLKLWLHNAHSLAAKAKETKWVRWDVLLWASLGPIFASCSPTYALLLSVVFPQSTSQWILYTIVYALWFALLLLIFAYGGRAIIKRFSRASNPTWWFKKWLWILLVITWLLIVTWYMKKLEVALVNSEIFDVTKIEQKLLLDMPMNSQSKTGPDLGQENHNTMTEWQRLLNENYPAPDIAGLDNWINWWNYKSLKDLKGKVVLLDFWTYSCVNCVRTLEALKSWDEKYADKWLVIVWVHAPEFQFEKDPANVKKAVEEYGLKYPVAQDNNFTTRRSYNNRFWPAKYIIDKEWNVRYTHFGEGEYEETEKVIQYLLGVEGNETISMSELKADYQPEQTHETYLGSLRADPEFMSKMTTVQLWQRLLAWDWVQEPEYEIMYSATGSLFMKFYASEINLVMGNNQGVTTAEIYLDGKLVNSLTIEENKLYQLWKWDVYGMHNIEIRYVGKWLEAYAFTFG